MVRKERERRRMSGEWDICERVGTYGEIGTIRFGGIFNRERWHG